MQKCWLPLLALVLLAAPAPCVAEPGVIVTRKVTGDQFAAPTRLGTTGGCPARIDEPEPGDTVRLSVVGAMARRDEPALSVIVRLDDGVAFVLHHAAQTFSRLRWPPRAGQVESEYRRRMGPTAKEVYPYRAVDEVERAEGEVAGRTAQVRSLTVESPLLGGRLDVAVAVAPQAELGRAAFAVETMTQAIRGEGESWLEQLGPEDGLPLQISRVTHLPSAEVHRVEQAMAVEEADLDAAIFEPPTGYREVEHQPTCF